ncbi:MAG: alanine--glyoxylate aminotransferase family protein [Nitrospinae bacterium]|nr:alanine--glyoxylate aminotransferase family protein [Nitrospinota bacterium]
MMKNYLLTPGPTPVPSEALLAMAQPMIHHRTPQFSAIFNEAKENLKWLFRTEEDVIMLAASGTGAMESAITNCFSKGDEVIVINGGKFGERWGQISEKFGLKVIWINVEWGEAVDVEIVKSCLEENPNVKGLLVQASETSTTVSHPIKELAELTKDRNTLFIVDGITAVGVMEVPMDEWGIDILITGSQKALMLPPGLAFIGLSKKAWEMAEDSNLPHYYFDLKKERKNLAKDTTAYTPAVTLIIGLNEVLKQMREEGHENIVKRHDRLARAAKAGVQALGLKLLAPNSPSNCATGFFLPEEVDGKVFVKTLRDEFGVAMAGGQDHLTGKIVRLAHIGYFSNYDIVIGLSAIEMGLRKFGVNVEFGKGVAAAQEILIEEYM